MFQHSTVVTETRPFCCMVQKWTVALFVFVFLYRMIVFVLQDCVSLFYIGLITFCFFVVVVVVLL